MGNKKEKKPSASQKNVNKVTVKNLNVNGRASRAASADDKLTKKQIIALIAITTVAVIIAGIIIGTVASSRVSRNPDLMTYNLSKYIDIDEADYKGYVIDVPLDTYSDSLLENRINILRTSKKTETEEYKGGYVSFLPLALGDEAHIYYRGYTVDENGMQVDIAGTSNFSEDDMAVIEVGTGNVMKKDSTTGKMIVSDRLIDGFGEALLGKTPSDYNTFEKITDGRIASTDIIYLSYTVMGEGVNKSVSYERIDLSRADIAEKYGKGFVEFFAGTSGDGTPTEPKMIGEKIEDSFIVRLDGHTTDTVYSDMKVEFVTRCESVPLTISVRFPASYSNKDLRGKLVYFDVFVRFAKKYDVPEFDDEFITESLKVNTHRLSEFSGETLVDKYRDKLQKRLQEQIESSNHELLAEAMFEYILSKVEIKTLPSGLVEEHIQSNVTALQQEFSTYKDNYTDINEYASLVYGIDESIGYYDYFKALAESSVAENIVFYYIIRKEGFIPSEEEYESLKADIYQDILEYNIELNEEELLTLEESDYLEKVALLEKEMKARITEEDFRENVYYYYGTRKMLALVALTR